MSDVALGSTATDQFEAMTVRNSETARKRTKLRRFGPDALGQTQTLPPISVEAFSGSEERTGIVSNWQSSFSQALDVKERKLASNRSVASGFLLVCGCDCDGGFRGEHEKR